MPKKFYIPARELRRLYWELGWTQARIAAHYGCGPGIVHRRMKEYGIPTRHVGDYIRIEISCAELRELYATKRLSTTQIADQKNCATSTIHRKLTECGISLRPISRPPVASVPESLLASWPTPDLAYVVGQLTTDGNLQRKNNHVSFISTDYEMIENYCGCLQLDPEFEPYNKLPTQEGRKPSYIVGFSDSNFRLFLENLGLTPAKSLTLGPLDIPASVFPDFARGCWDGDGGFCISHQNRNGRRYAYLHSYLCSSSRVFLEWMRDQIELYTGLHSSISSKRLRYRGKKAVAFGHWLYYAPHLPKLTRKWTIWKQSAQMQPGKI